MIILFSLFVFVVSLSGCSDVISERDTASDIKQISSLSEQVKQVLEETDLYNQDLYLLLLGTAAVESDFGRINKQKNGPALGYFQMEPETLYDIFDNYLKYKPELKKLALKYIEKDKDLVKQLQYNIEFQVIMAALHYIRACDKLGYKLPDSSDKWSLAWFWKKVYNTKYGRGNTTIFFEKYNKYVET